MSNKLYVVIPQTDFGIPGMREYQILERKPDNTWTVTRLGSPFTVNPGNLRDNSLVTEDKLLAVEHFKTLLHKSIDYHQERINRCAVELQRVGGL